MEPETSGKKSSNSEEDYGNLKVTTPEGGENRIPKPVRAKSIVFSLHLDLTKDWAVIQLIYSLPPRHRSRIIRDMLRIVINAAHIWSEKQPNLRLRHGKKLTEEQRKSILRTKLGLR